MRPQLYKLLMTYVVKNNIKQISSVTFETNLEVLSVNLLFKPNTAAKGWHTPGFLN